MRTHTFTLTSGVECEVKEFTGKHQRILTEQGNKKLGDSLNAVILDILVRVGTKTNFDDKFVKDLLSSDRKKILTEARQFTMDFEPNFKFNYDYASQAGTTEQEPLEVDLSKGFPFRTLKVVKEDGVLVDAAYTEYDQIERHVHFELPSSKTRVRWELLNGKNELAALQIPKGQRSSHTSIALRNPVYFKGETPIQVDLDSLGWKDIEALRKHIKDVEGQVDTEMMFAHPEAEFKPKSEKEIVVDLLNVMAFFFPSEAI